MITIPLILFLVAFALVLVHAITGKVPLWIPVLLVIIALMVQPYVVALHR